MPFNFLRLTILTAGLLPLPAAALTLIIEPRDRSAISHYDIEAYSDAGETTIMGLERHKVPYTGSQSGIASINGLGSDLEVVNDSTMKAWGWCFTIDGNVSDQMPDKTPLPSTARELKWFYAFALYDNGAWTGYCLQD